MDLFNKRKVERLERELEYMKTRLWKAQHPKKFSNLDRVKYSKVEGDETFVISQGGYGAHYYGQTMDVIERYWSYSLISPTTKAIMYSAREDDLTLVED